LKKKQGDLITRNGETGKHNLCEENIS